MSGKFDILAAQEKKQLQYFSELITKIDYSLGDFNQPLTEVFVGKI